MYFNEITFYTNMTKATKQSSTFTCARALLDELKMTHMHLSSANDASRQGEKSLFVVARLIADMDRYMWEEFCKKAPSAGWCALEVCLQNGETTVPFTHVNPLQNMCTDMGSSQSETDSLTQALLTTSFMTQLEQEVQRARRGNAPLSLAYFTLATDTPKHMQVNNGGVDGKTLAHIFPVVYTAVQKCAESCDTLGSIGAHHLGLILPGAKVFTAQNLVEDVLSNCAAEGLKLKAGIATSLGIECEAISLLEQASMALEDAIQNKRYVSAYKAPVQTLDTRSTLVQSHEKRFLFGGE